MKTSNKCLGNLKVPELKEELKARGLPMTGNKPVLVKRLQSAIMQAAHERREAPARAPVQRQQEHKVMGQRAAKEAASEAAAAAGDGFMQQLVAVHLLPVYFTGYTPAPFFVVRPPQQHAYYT
jgi:hypothetical protein